MATSGQGPRQQPPVWNSHASSHRPVLERAILASTALRGHVCRVALRMPTQSGGHATRPIWTQTRAFRYSGVCSVARRLIDRLVELAGEFPVAPAKLIEKAHAGSHAMGTALGADLAFAVKIHPNIAAISYPMLHRDSLAGGSFR